MKHAREILFAALLTFLVPFVRAYEMRTWTAMNGKTTEAAYVKYEYDSQKVVMQMRDGTIIKVNRDALCDEDWIYVMKYDPSIFEIFVLLGETTCNIGSGSKTTRFFASNTKMVRIVQDGSIIAETPLIPSVFPPFTGDTDLKPIWSDIYSEWDHRKWRWYLEIHVMKTIEISEKVKKKGTWKWKHGPSNRKVKINAESGKQFRWLREKSNFGEVTPEDYRSLKEQFESQFHDSWMTLQFDSRIEDDINNLQKNALAIEQLLQHNARFSRISNILKNINAGVPPAESGEKPETELKLRGTGSGFFISSDGYFLTNYHVVQGSKNIRLRTVFGNTSASVLRVDPGVDLALLKADKRGFVPLPFAAEPSASLGEDIFTIGFPMPDLQGFSPKMTKGVISSLNGIQDDDVQYQIDASIQPGNSGGPLVNNQGELVGVIVSKLKDSLVVQKKGVLPQNVNYAIKKKHVLDFLAQVPACLHSIQTSNQPATGKSATPETIEAVQNSCAMVIVFE